MTREARERRYPASDPAWRRLLSEVKNAVPPSSAAVPCEGAFTNPCPAAWPATDHAADPKCPVKEGAAR